MTGGNWHQKVGPEHPVSNEKISYIPEWPRGKYNIVNSMQSQLFPSEIS